MAQDADAPAVIGELQQRGVVAETFFGEAHRILYRRLCALADAGRPTTLPTVLTALRESEELESVGGEVVIRLIAAEGTVTSQVPRHVDEILRLALKRETEAACLRLAEHARNGSGPADLIAEVNALATRIEHGIVREPSPIVERRPDDVQVKFVSAAVVFTFAALHHGREGLHATCAVTLRGRPIGPPSRVNLLGPKTRPDYARELSRIAPGPVWGALLDAACLALAAIAHEGGEVEAIIPAPLPGGDLFVLEPLLVVGELNAWHAQEGSAKTTLALAAAQQLYTGRVVLPGTRVSVRSVKTLFVNYETTSAPVAAVVHALGFDEAKAALVHFRTDRSLADIAPHLRRLVWEHDVGLVEVDSLQLAITGSEGAGRGDPSEPYLRLFNALASLRRPAGGPVTSLILAHHSNAENDKPGPRRPYGSAFISIKARHRVELRSTAIPATATTPAGLAVECWNHKANFGAKAAPLALRISYSGRNLADPDLKITFTAAPPPSAEAAPPTGALPFRIRLALATSPLTVAELAAHLGKPEDTIRTTIKRLTDLVTVPDTRPAKWALASTRTEGEQ